MSRDPFKSRAIDTIIYPSWHSVGDGVNQHFLRAALIDFGFFSLLKIDAYTTQTEIHAQSNYPAAWTCVCIGMVEADGIEPTTPCLQSRCSPN